jgi:hypothetical protein
VLSETKYLNPADERGRSDSRCGPVVFCVLVWLLPALLAAQAPAVASCAPVAATRGVTFAFGHEGGTLRPRAVSISANGLVRVGTDAATDSVNVIAPAAVAALATLARTGGFWTLRPRPVRSPPRNPDAARAYISVTLTCGSHRADYVAGDREPAAFTQLKALLAQVTASNASP